MASSHHAGQGHCSEYLSFVLTEWNLNLFPIFGEFPTPGVLGGRAPTHFGSQRGADRPSPARAAGLWAHKPSGPEGVFAQDFIFYIIDLTFLVYSSMNCNTGIDSCDHHHHPQNQEKWDRYKLFTMCQCPDTWASRGGQCPEAAATPAQGGLPLGVTLVTSSSPAFLSSNQFSEPASPAFSHLFYDPPAFLTF